jgi:hypothetical protein
MNHFWKQAAEEPLSDFCYSYLVEESINEVGAFFHELCGYS